MSPRESALIKYGGGMLLGISLSIAAHQLEVDDKFADPFLDVVGAYRDKDTNNYAISADNKPYLQLPLQEPELKPEILRLISENIVSLNIGILPEYQQYKFIFNSGDCSGFIIRNWRNIPFVFTAEHCVPLILYSEDFKKTFVSNAYDRSVFDVKILSSFGAVELSSLTRPGSDDPESPDLAVFTLKSDDKLKPKGLPINMGSLKKWDLFYRVTRTEEGVAVSALRFLESQGTGFLMFIDMGDPTLSCKPGSSGSAVVNSLGEVVGLLTSAPMVDVTREIAIQFNLDPKHIGREIPGCEAVDAIAIRDLLPN